MEKIRLKVQLFFAAVFNIGLLKLHFICFPVLNCHSCPISVFACPLGVIGQFTAAGLVPLTVIGGIALAGVLIGRLLCGWACPFGLIQDLLNKVPYIEFNIPSQARYVKYGVFLGLVVAVPYFLTTASNLYFCRLCPVATFESAIPWAIMNGTSHPGWLAVRIAVLSGIVILVMGHHRFFCKVLCPLGACLSVFNRFAAVFPQRADQCIECSVCKKSCPMTTGSEEQTIAVFDNHSEECISCLSCKDKCPTSAVSIWGGR